MYTLPAPGPDRASVMCVYTRAPRPAPRAYGAPRPDASDELGPAWGPFDIFNHKIITSVRAGPRAKRTACSVLYGEFRRAHLAHLLLISGPDNGRGRAETRTHSRLPAAFTSARIDSMFDVAGKPTLNRYRWETDRSMSARVLALDEASASNLRPSN